MTGTNSEYDAALSIRFRRTTKDRLKDMARQNKRKLTDYARLVLEEHAEQKPKRAKAGAA
jgi:predicted DNA-binding protein